MLLTLPDFPAGWVHQAAGPRDDLQASDPGPFTRCISSAFAGQTGRAVGGEFSDKDTTTLSINPSVYVFDNAADAQSAAQSIISEVQCFADVIGDGLDTGGTVKLGQTYTEPLQADAFGATAAIRSFDTQIYRDQQRSDVLVFDVVIVVRGRVLYDVDGFQRYSPIDQSLLKTYVDKARGKIRQEP